MATNMDESHETDFYKLINVSRTASEAEIRKAFRKRALELHPDKNPGSEEMMKRLTMAKDTLLDPEKRLKYDDEHDDVGTAQDISGVLHCGKRLSSRYKRNLAKYMANFRKLKIKDNCNVVFETLADLNNKLIELINTSVTTTFQDTSPSSRTSDTETLRSYFYQGQYTSMAKFLIENHCDSSCISILHQQLTSGRDISGTPPPFQAGLLLLKGQLSANDLKHQESLEAFQQAVFTCPSDDIISAVAILMRNSHFVAAIQSVIHQLLKGEVDTVQAHKYQDRLKRTKHLRIVSKFENGVIQDTKTSNWDKAMMYIDLTMAASGIAVIHCFFVAMTYMLEEISTEEDVAKMYAICNIICELAINVVVLARRCALPVTEMHFNKLSFIIMRKAHEILRSKIKTCKTSFWGKIFTFTQIETPIVTTLHNELYKMIANTIYRLVRVSPLVDLQLSTVADMIYLDVISDQFVEEFYKYKISSGQEPSVSHLYKYYLLECAWKTGNDSKFVTYREECMNGLLDNNGWSSDAVEETMWWDVLNRDEDGWLDINRPWLNLQGKNYDSVDGVEVDIERGTFRVLYTPSPPGKYGLFDDQDIMEVIHNGLKYSIFTLDPPDNDLQYHPFHQLKYSPQTLLHTHFLQTLLHADYLLKMMSMGTEVSANAPHPFRNAYNKGFFNLLPPRLREKVRPVSKRRGGDKKENVHRFWIESGVLEYKSEEVNEGKTLKYTLGPCQMQVKTHLMKHNSEGELVDDSEDDDESDEDDEEDIGNRKKPPKPKKKRISAETEFANDFTECYDEVGHYFPILLRLRELMKLVCVYGILNNIYDNLETAKKKLNESLTLRFSKALKLMRNHITYPQNNSSNVNKIYRSVLRDQGINESNLASGEEDRAKRAIRQQLDEADAKIVVDVAESLASSLQISDSSEFRTKVRKWLNDGLFTSYTKDLVQYIVEQVYPHEYEKLDRFAKNAASNGICFGRENDDDMDEKDDFTLTGADDECPWVPAAFCHEEWRRVYGGVCLLPQLRNVTNFNGTYKTGNYSFMRNPAGRPAAPAGGGSSGGGGDDGSGKKGHGNWRGSSRPQHVYEIRKHNPGGNVYMDSKRDARQHPTLVHKVGISNDVVYQRNREGMTERIGNSVRAQRQTDDLNKRYVEKQVKKAENRGAGQGDIGRLREYYRQHPVYTCHIVERIPGGQGARVNALEAERSRINSTLENQGSVFGVNAVPGNQEPATSTYKQQLFQGKTLPDKTKSTVNYKKGEN